MIGLFYGGLPHDGVDSGVKLILITLLKILERVL